MPPPSSKDTKRISSQINKIVILLARNVVEYFYINRNVFHNQLKVCGLAHIAENLSFSAPRLAHLCQDSGVLL